MYIEPASELESQANFHARKLQESKIKGDHVTAAFHAGVLSGMSKTLEIFDEDLDYGLPFTLPTRLRTEAEKSAKEVIKAMADRPAQPL